MMVGVEQQQVTWCHHAYGMGGGGVGSDAPVHFCDKVVEITEVFEILGFHHGGSMECKVMNVVCMLFRLRKA
jgi:hypothetical protein